jgi:hypothetical protein
MAKSKSQTLAEFTTAELLKLTGATRAQVQRLENASALTAVSIGQGRTPNIWSMMHVIGVAYYLAFLDAGMDHTWGYAACDWLSRHTVEDLVTAFQDKTKALLALSPNGDGSIIEPYLKPGASREQQLQLVKLDLKAVTRRLLLKMGAELSRKAAQVREQARQGGIEAQLDALLAEQAVDDAARQKSRR